MGHSRTPLTSREEDALDYLEQYLNEPADDEHHGREDAVAHLTEHEFEPADARALIEQLLLKGYLYEVEDELRIPPRT